jgi:hypothetical protein
LQRCSRSSDVATTAALLILANLETPRERDTDQPASRAPRAGLQVMALVLVVMTLLAIYSSYQRAHRSDIETVTITPAASPAATPSDTPVPAAP